MQRSLLCSIIPYNISSEKNSTPVPHAILTATVHVLLDGFNYKSCTYASVQPINLVCNVKQITSIHVQLNCLSNATGTDVSSSLIYTYRKAIEHFSSKCAITNTGS